MPGDVIPQLGAGGILGILFVVVLRLMLRADNLTREAVTEARGDRDDCHDALDRERAARLEDRRRCDEQLAELRGHANQLEIRVAVLEAEQRRSRGDGR